MKAFVPRSMHIYEIRPRASMHGFDLSSDVLRYSPLWYRGSNPIVDAVGYARSYSRSHPVVIRVYDPTGNVIGTLEYGRVHNFVTLIVQLRRAFDKRVQSIPKTLENWSRWFEQVRSRLVAEIVSDLPRFSAGINSRCFSHDRLLWEGPPPVPVRFIPNASGVGVIQNVI